ncbi:MAG: hypothetical protein OXG53_09615 [Chloroflexi bacterium]|nr:hypothetical protein [Chloroflexota bacterium]
MMNKQKRKTQRGSGCLYLVSAVIGKALVMIGGLFAFALIIVGIISLTQPNGGIVPAPTPSLESTVRSLVRMRYPKIDIRSVEDEGDAVLVAYNFHPWMVVPNELIAQEVVYKILCSIRRTMKKDLEFRGHVRMTDDYGRRSYPAHVSIHLRANTVQKIGCTGSDGWMDENWRRLADVHRTHSLPSHLKFDYGS